MFVCTECSKIFKTGKVFYEEFFGGKYEGCPDCCGPIAETFECESCHEYIVEDYIQTKNGYKYCENCYIRRNVGD